jgi:hypothetical protein
MVIADGGFPAEVARELGFLTAEHGLRATRESEYIVEMESPSLWAQAVWDPRGEVVVHVRRLGVAPFGDAHYGEWTYSGMTGRATRARLLELAVERLKAEPAVLSGDPEFYDQLARDQHRQAVEWTAYYARKGPRPSHGPLP